MFPTSLIWALENFPASFVEIKTANPSEAVRFFEDEFGRNRAEAYQNLQESIPEEARDDKDFFPLKSDECFTVQMNRHGDSVVAIFDPLTIPYCYGEFCELDGACQALDKTISSFKERFPDADITGYVSYPWSDRRCGDVVCYPVGEEKTVYPVFADIVNMATEGKDLFGNVVEDPADDFSFAQKLTEEIEEAYEASEFDAMIRWLALYGELLSATAKETLTNCIIGALNNTDDDIRDEVVKMLPDFAGR